MRLTASCFTVFVALLAALPAFGVEAGATPAPSKQPDPAADINKPRADARTIAFDTEAAIHDPPSTGDCGSVESPSLTLTLSSGRPSLSAATCAMIV